MKKKWLVLGCFALAAGLSQFLWLSFAPLVSFIEKTYGVSEDRAGLLLMVFPLTYILISIPAGSLIDRRGYRFGIGLGLLLMAGFACVRVFAPGFGWLLAAQAGISLGQPLVVNGITKLVLDWFGKEEEAIATGIGTVGMFVGMAAGMVATPTLVQWCGFQMTMVIFAAISLAVTALFFLVVHPNPSNPAHVNKIAEPAQLPLLQQLGALCSDPSLALIFTLAFLGMGFFNGLTTWLEPILAQNGIDAVNAGIVGGCLIVGGIFGAAVIPGFSDRMHRRKPFLIGSTVAALAAIYPLTRSANLSAVIGLATALGFFFLPAYSLMLQICAELAGPDKAGAATGILMLAGNVGGVAIIISMQWVKSAQTGFLPAVHLLAIVLCVTALLANFLRETHPSLRAPLNK